ncbi:MAG: XrtA/PEP-CTERM system histidine kinase PrsK [Burkholderiales bacterium]
MVGLAGYALAAAAWLGLAALLGARGTGRGAGRWLLAAALVEAVWGAVLAGAVAGVTGPIAVSIVEAARPLAWTLVMVALLRDGVTAVRPGPGAPPREVDADVAPPRRTIGRSLPAIAVGLALVSVAADAGSASAHRHDALDLLAAVLVLVCVEQLYRNTDPAHRWAIKDLCLAVGAATALDVLIGADALRTGRVDDGVWAARGFAHALVAPLAAVSAARNREWRLPIKLSREVVFHSAALIGSLALVLASVALGWAVRLAGPDWGRVVQAVLLFAAATAALTLVGSRGLRARARVALAKNFFSFRYDYRSEWLRLTRLLALPDDGGSGALGVRSLRALRDLVDSPGGTLWVAAPHGDFVRDAHVGDGDRPALHADEPLLGWLRSRGWIVELDEWRREPMRYDGLVLPSALAGDPRAWLVLPLFQQDELVAVALLDRPAVPSAVDWEVRDLLKAAGRQVAGFLALRAAGERLERAGRFESFNRMSAFVVHDLKTLVAQLSLMLGNAARHRADPEFQRDMLATVEHVVGRMQSLMDELGGGAGASRQRVPVPLATALHAAVRARAALRPRPELEPLDAAAGSATVLADPRRLERIVGHLVQNACEATRPDGRVWVRARIDGDEAVVEIADTGSGMSPEFVERRLFRPFASTKGRGLGLGTFECSEYLRELGGRLEVRTAPGSGTTFIARMPCATERAPALQGA